jgi:RND family efflux transporter MFP subunit
VRRHIAAWIAAGTAVWLVGCGRGGPPQGVAPPGKAPYATVVARAEPVAQQRLVDGRVEAVLQATVAARTSGEVIEIVQDAGAAASKNAVVLRLRSIEQRTGLAQAQASARAASARLAEAEARYKRIANLHERKVVAQSVLDNATAQRDGARAERDAAVAARSSAQAGLGYTEVRMPFKGFVTDRLVRVGEIVSPGTPLFAAAAPDQLRVIADISPELALAVRERPKARVLLETLEWQTDNVTVYPRASDDAAAVRVRLDLASGASGLLPGMYVKVAFETGSAPRILIPRAAIVERGEVTAVYVFSPQPPGRTLLRQVRLGQVHGDRIEVLSGLVDGDQVALDPALAWRQLRP